MSFKKWLLIAETDVKNWEDEIKTSSYSRSFAFENWFPTEGRVYIPFESEESEDLKIDKDIENYFKDHQKYEILDYLKGLAADKISKRPMKIGKILEMEAKKEENKIKASYENKQISDIKYQDELKWHKEYYKGLLSTFTSSKYRVGFKSTSPYMIVFSSIPEDIAAMSTNRNWTSCMNLQGGINRESVFCEIKNGGFIAYLCLKDDKNIEKPLARVLVRRFDNKAGKSIAVLEESIYGNPLDGFEQQVQKWIDSKQGKIKPAKYIRKGGWHSDTFGTADPDDSAKKQRRDMTKIFYPKTADGLFKMLEKKREPEVTREILEKLLDKNLVLDEKNKAKLINLINSEWTTNTFDNVFKAGFKRKLFLKYPDILDDQEFSNLRSYDRRDLARDNPKFKELQKGLATNAILSFDPSNPSLKINNPEYGRAEAYNQITDIVLDFYGTGKLTEPLIRKLVEISEYFLKIYEAEKEPSWTGPIGIIKHILGVLSNGDADTPTVVRFYSRLLPYSPNISYNTRDDLFMDGLGIALARLGENGRQFLPFLQQKLQESKENKYMKEKIEYVIDSIENGTGRSNKYKFY